MSVFPSIAQSLASTSPSRAPASANPLPQKTLPKKLVAGPITGTRVWRLYRARTFANDRPQVTTPWRLHSMTTNTPWQPMFPQIATCSRCEGHSPTPGCACGLYAMIPPHLPESTPGISSILVRGSVALWGRVIRHEYGYRAQYAYPLSLTIRVGPLPPGFPGRASLEAIRSALATDYGCPVTLG